MSNSKTSSTSHPQSYRKLIMKSDPLAIIKTFIAATIICLLLTRLIEYEIYFDKTPEQHASELLKSGGNLPPKKDRWGTPLKSSYSSQSEANIASVTSAGRDKVFGTRDDISSEKKDINKSRAIGEWAGEKAREAGSGFLKGLLSKSKHETTN